MITTINEFKNSINESMMILTPEQLKGRSEMKAYFINRLLQGPATIGQLTMGTTWQNASKFRHDLVGNNIIFSTNVNGKIVYDFTDDYKRQHNLI